MRADVTLTEAEYLAANRAHAMLLMTNGPGLIFPAAMAAWFVTLTLILSGPGLPDALVAVGLGLILGAVIWLVLVGVTLLTLKRRTRHLYTQQKALMEPTAFTWDGHAFSSQSESQSSRILWPNMVRWSETERALLLFPNDLIFYVLPDQALTAETKASLIAELTVNGAPRWQRWQGLRGPERRVDAHD